MPMDNDVFKARISEVRLAMDDLRRLASKPYVELSVDEKYSMRYNIMVLVESLASLCVHIAVEAYAAKPTSYREAIRVVAERLGLSCIGDLRVPSGFKEPSNPPLLEGGG